MVVRLIHDRPKTGHQKDLITEIRILQKEHRKLATNNLKHICFRHETPVRERRQKPLGDSSRIIGRRAHAGRPLRRPEWWTSLLTKE